MLRVLDECENVSADFSADPVHDLRVSLRRCRSLADGMVAMDPDPAWRAMKKAGKQLFQRLGALRDVQIMMEWIGKLQKDLGTKTVEQVHPTNSEEGNADLPLTVAAGVAVKPVLATGGDPGQALLEILKARESDLKNEARTALADFDSKQWRQWSRSLPLRAARIRPGSAVFQHLALERWTAARELHTRAMRNRSQVALHTLRIGIKRFRYIVENFLPAEHEAWSNDLKHMQDLLGEVHDLDVLWSTANSCHVFPDESARKAWHETVAAERRKRVDEYRQRTTGPGSVWNIWRAGLPEGKRIQELATRRMKIWAKALDPDFAHSERVARLSIQLYDGLTNSGLVRITDAASSGNGHARDLRASLYAAALLHDVGKTKGDKRHHKESAELIKQHGTPLGWQETDLRRAALVARFHAGAIPTRTHKALRDLLPEEQRYVIQLSAILRLANALDSSHDGSVRRVTLEGVFDPAKSKHRTNGLLRKQPAVRKNEAVVIAADGYVESGPAAQTVAAERYLLETVLKRPVIVKPASTARRLGTQN